MLYYLLYKESKMTIVGTIPKQIYYLVREKTAIDSSIKNLDQYITIVTDSLNSSDARNWARKSNVSVTNNVPLSNLQIVKLLSGNKGVIYKVLINNYLVDLQEDVLFDTIISSGIEAGGTIKKCQFIWGKVGSSLKLIRVGSNLYYDLLDSNKKKTLPKIKNSQLEIGGIYRTRNGTTRVFLDKVNTVKYKHDYIIPFKYENILNNGLMLFCEIPRYGKKNNLKQFIDFQLSDWSNLDSLYFSMTTNNSFVEKIGTVNLPDNFINTIRTYYKSKSAYILSKVENEYKSSWSENSPMQASRTIAYNSIFLNMYPINSDCKFQLFDVKKYLLFV